MSRVVKLAVIPGDGIGPEVVAEAEKVLDAVTEGAEVTFEKTRFSLGAARYLETGDLSFCLAGNAPIIVDARTGAATVTGTAHPVEHYIAEYERAQRLA